MTEQVEKVIDIGRSAGEVLLKYWQAPIEVEYKKDEFDPVTKADKEADMLVRNELAKAFPDDLVLSEENEFNPAGYDGRVWMVDPLDDTKSFTNGLDCFAVSIGCVENGVPILGVVVAPARGLTYYATKGGGAFLRSKDGEEKLEGSTTREVAAARIIVGLPSKAVRPINDTVAAIPFGEFIKDGSIALALGRLAAGDAECTINTNPRVSKWDSAAGEAILREVGGLITDKDGNPLDYKQVERGWSNLVVASTNPEVHAEFVEALVD